MGDNRDQQPPKSGRIWDRPQSQPVVQPKSSTAVPAEVYEDVTGRYDLSPRDEVDARFRRDVMRMLRQQNAKTGAIGKFMRDQFRAMADERERRRSAEDKAVERKEQAKHRRHQLWSRFVGLGLSPKLWTAIGAAVAGVLTALKATGNL